ncbi:hypothetical protein [Methanoculleus thermophilus]|uniref:Uncharacterized protein n=1 Tax=Methanoculleus thermophilus TaxID=2200 RepID=A0A1G8ZVG9_9EURY|nr:hypothetical protein [Methanoculleus thermophilus]SDK19043.1 hypothetical protein SAMN04488571_10535 [Methanoculleus thermophilus]
MTEGSSVVPALLLTAAVTALAAGFAVFWPGTKVVVIQQEQIARRIKHWSISISRSPT